MVPEQHRAFQWDQQSDDSYYRRPVPTDDDTAAPAPPDNHSPHPAAVRQKQRKRKPVKSAPAEPASKSVKRDSIASGQQATAERNAGASTPSLCNLLSRFPVS